MAQRERNCSSEGTKSGQCEIYLTQRVEAKDPIVSACDSSVRKQYSGIVNMSTLTSRIGSKLVQSLDAI